MRSLRPFIILTIVVFSVSRSAGQVITPGQEALFLEMGKLGADFTLTDVSISKEGVTFSYVYQGKNIGIRLVHPEKAEKPLALTSKFAIVGVGDSVPPKALIEAFEAKILALEARFDWGEEPDDKKYDGYYRPALPRDATPFELMPSRLPPLPKTALEQISEAKTLLRQGNKKEAIGKAVRIAEAWPSSEQVARASAMLLRAAGNGKEALRLLRRFTWLDNAELYVEYVASLIAAGQVAEARSLTKRKWPCAFVEALELLALEGRLDLAKKYAPPLAKQRCLAVFHLKLAHALKNDESVDQMAERALSMFPNDEAILYLWGYHYYIKKAMDRAIPPWERLVARNFRFPAVLGQFGTAYLVSGRLKQEGVGQMLKRVQENPNDIVASFLAGLGLYYLKQYEQVIPLLEPVVKAVPDESRARLYLAMAHYFVGHHETAQQMFEEMEPYAYHDPDIFYCRSLIYRKRDLTRAIKEMERFLEVFVGEGRPDFGPEKVEKAKSDLERMKRGEVPELNLPGEPFVPAM